MQLFLFSGSTGLDISGLSRQQLQIAAYRAIEDKFQTNMKWVF